MSIYVNSKIDFVFAQKNAVRCIGEQNKMIEGGDRLFLWRKVGLMGSGVLV